MRCILRSVVVALVMAAMILAMAMPALAERPLFNPGVNLPPAANETTYFIVCREGGEIVFAAFGKPPGGSSFVNRNAVNEGFHTGSGSGCERGVVHER